MNEPTIAFDLTDLYAKTLIQAHAAVDDSRLKQIEQVSIYGLIFHVSFPVNQRRLRVGSPRNRPKTVLKSDTSDRNSIDQLV